MTSEVLDLYRIDETQHDEENMATLVVRQVAPPSTNSKGSIFQRDSSLRI
jgi:hypothetical protein